jgi:hypothetical protein
MLFIQTSRVLIVWDIQNDSVEAIKQALSAENDVVLSAKSETEFDGTELAAGYEAVIKLDGNTYGQETPAAGQAALVQFVNNGGIYIAGEWDAFEFMNGAMQGMRDLIILDRTSGTQGDMTMTKSADRATDPIFDGVADSVTVNSGGNVGPAHVFTTNPVAVLMQDANGNPTLARRSLGAGTVYNFSLAFNYLGDQDTSLKSPDIQKIIANMISAGPM